MRRTNLPTILAVLLVLMLLVPGCRRLPEPTPAEESPTPDVTIRLGVFMSLTGETAHYGLSATNGIRLAVEEANARGGIGGRRVQLFVQDTRSDLLETEIVVKRLVNEFRAHALLGEVVSSRSLAAAPLAQAARVPMLTPSATSPEVTRMGTYVFRSCYTNPYQGAALAQFAAGHLGARRAALLYERGQLYSANLASYVREAFEEHGGEVVFEQEYEGGEGDFAPLLEKLGASRPDVIFLPGYYREAGLLVRQARAKGIEATFIGGDGWDSRTLYEIGGLSMVGTFFSSHFTADDTDPSVVAFAESYRLLFGAVPDGFAASGYDAARIMLDALARSPTLDGPSVRAALAETRDFPGVTGRITFDEQRDAIKPIVIIKIEEGGRYAVQSRIRPEEMAFVPGISPTPSPTPTPRPKTRRRPRRR